MTPPSPFKTQHMPARFQPLLLFLVGFLLAFSPAKAQKSSPEVPILQLSAHYGFQLPGGDMQQRFGSNGQAGLQADWTFPSGWTLGLQASLLFGKDVKEDVLSQLRDENGLIYGYNGAPATLLLRERGQYYGFHTGWLFKFPGKHRAGHGGLIFQVGTGLLQHKIRIAGDPTNPTPQIADPYAKGYDRLSNGAALRQSLGYRYLSDNRRINFQLEFEAYQAFTRNRRDWNIDQLAADHRERLDLLFGFRFSWILPFYIGESGDEIEYY